MKILYIYRNAQMGYSIGKVFKPIEKEVCKYYEVDSIELPSSNYRLIGLYKNIMFVLRYCRKHKYDIIHITGSDFYLIPFLKNKGLVVTVHDLGFYTNQKKNFKTLWIYITRVKTLTLAKRVTFISRKSYLEACKILKFKENQCNIIPNPVDSSFFNISQNYKLNKKIIVLQIGTLPNKNIDRTIKALDGIKCHYRIVGILSNENKKMLEKYNIDYSNVFNLSDEEILKEYIHSDIICFPSLYEGFGMPIVEGQAVGKIVITSNLSPMKEIAGEGSAIFVNPYDVKSIHEGIIKAMLKPQKIINKGKANAEKYKVNNIVQSYINLYEEILE